jgi:transposase
MITFFWNSSGLYVHRFLESGKSVNSTYFIEYVLGDIEHLPVLQTAIGQKKKSVLHMDNSPIHESCAVTQKVASLPLALAPHRLYSPELAQSDFFLFGYLKEKIPGIDFESPHALIDWIQLICQASPRHALDKVFESWLRRAQDCINSQGSYIKS